MTTSTQYIIDENGDKTGVILSIEDYEALLEDLDDFKIALERRSEDLISFDDMKKEYPKNE
ncbi:MAG: hypothetical protein INQ03_24995 [Candidatus Heimdallarchaeota archaeon]|nr:hypothetical protein [Candidatus Heimdallarchaeota archaeon]